MNKIEGEIFLPNVALEIEMTYFWGRVQLSTSLLLGNKKNFKTPNKGIIRIRKSKDSQHNDHHGNTLGYRNICVSC
jgi:hypothetical protein